MNKLLFGALSLFLYSNIAFSATAQSSTVSLPGEGDVAPAKSFAVSLNPLIKNVEYDVRCDITNPNPANVDMRFDLDQTAVGSGYGEFSLNGTMLDNNQGPAVGGSNSLEVTVSVSKDGSTLVFKNLDFSQSVHVGHCIATPAIHTGMKTSSLDIFFAYNDTNKKVTIAVGNFFPTPYDIDPNSYRIVTVSSNNQNIHITKIGN